MSADQREQALAGLDDAIDRLPRLGPNAIYEAELLRVLNAARTALLANAEVTR